MLWLQPRCAGRELFLQRYQAAKLVNPCIGAAILLPAKYQSPVISRMHVLELYCRGTSIFTDTATSKHVKCKCDFLLYVDPPKSARLQPQSSAASPSTNVVPDRLTTSHAMQQVGAVGGVPAQILIDSALQLHLHRLLQDDRIGLAAIGTSNHCQGCARFFRCSWMESALQ